MDAALKARQLGSAAVRRQRIQERQFQQHLAHQQRLERKRHIMIDTRSVEDLDADSESETSSNMGANSAAGTPSETSVQTPESFSSPDEFVNLSTVIQDIVIDTTQINDKTEALESLVTTTEVVPKMQATLTTIADWNYDRFSIFMGPSDSEDEAEDKTDEEEEADISSASDEEMEECSPIETATPISYTMPKTKPSVVSISSSYYHIKPLSVVKQRALPRRHVSEQMVLDVTNEGSGVDGHRLFHAHNSSRETLGSSNGSSQVSRSVSLASQKDSIVSRSYSQTSQSDTSTRSPKRKSSMPLLFGGNKPGHSRMSSIKKFIRSSTLGPPAPNQRSLSGSTLETHFEDRGASMEMTREPATEEIKRPMTAAVRAPAPMFSMAEHTPALPISPAPPAPTEPAPPLPSNISSEDFKARPVSKFRSRSGSIGLALKSISSGPRKADPSAPPVPALFIPPFQSQLGDLGHVSAPPPLTPRNPRRTAGGYSPFPTSHEKKSPVFPEDNAFFERRAQHTAVGLGLALT